MLADGSELLLDILDPGFIGGFVLPVLGALPDATIVLVSCLGPIEEAQSQLAIGMGTLAGSTIMLLTLPWFASLFVARCDIVNGEAVDLQAAPFTRASWREQGVSVDKSVPMTAIIMLVTGLSYVIVQGPAFAWATQLFPAESLHNIERGFALTGFITSALMFLAYSIYMVRSTREQSKRTELARQKYLIEQVLKKLNVSLYRVPAFSAEATDKLARGVLSKWRVRSHQQPCTLTCCFHLALLPLVLALSVSPAHCLLQGFAVARRAGSASASLTDTPATPTSPLVTASPINSASKPADDSDDEDAGKVQEPKWKVYMEGN